MKTKKSDSKQYPFLLSCIGSYVLTFDIISHHLILQFRDALYFRMRHKRCRPFIRLLQHLLFCAGIKVCLSKPSLVRINLFFYFEGKQQEEEVEEISAYDRETKNITFMDSCRSECLYFFTKYFFFSFFVSFQAPHLVVCVASDVIVMLPNHVHFRPPPLLKEKRKRKGEEERKSRQQEKQEEKKMVQLNEIEHQVVVSIRLIDKTYPCSTHVSFFLPLTSPVLL
jgi:hypothetical protein